MLVEETMDTNYHAHQTPQFRILSDRQIEKLYLATLESLNRTGVEVGNAEALELLAAAGARVDGRRVCIPPHIIQDAVAASPRSFTLWSRDGKHRMQIVPALPDGVAKKIEAILQAAEAREGKG
jgi:trimethylamine--corrinoid protein Co-methyltransferase